MKTEEREKKEQKKGLSKFKKYYWCKKCKRWVTAVCIANKKEPKRFICKDCAEHIKLDDVIGGLE
jgi:hypothetical protein